MYENRFLKVNPTKIARKKHFDGCDLLKKKKNLTRFIRVQNSIHQLKK